MIDPRYGIDHDQPFDSKPLLLRGPSLAQRTARRIAASARKLTAVDIAIALILGIALGFVWAVSLLPQ
jgi:hypothetical protein